MNYKNVVTVLWNRVDLEKELEIYQGEYGRFLNKLDLSNKVVLEIGCGFGELLYWLSQRASKVIGIEPDRGMYKHRIKEVRCVDKIIVHNVDAFKFFNNKKINRQRYDVIIMNDVLEHIAVSKIINLLKLIYFNLKDGGLLLLRVPNAQSPFFGSCYRYGDITHKISFTRSSITQCLLASGFSLDNICVYSTSHRYGLIYYIGYFIRKLVEKIFCLVLFLYIGNQAFKTIFTPNLVVVAKK